jgi:integrase/recombinase XerD
MLSKIVVTPMALSRHRDAPLLAARESYLRRLEAEGKSRIKQRDAATYLLQVIKRLRLKRLRKVKLSELRRAAISWQRRASPSATGGLQARRAFLRCARGWLRFHGKLIEPKRWHVPRDKRVTAFRHYLRVELGFADQTIDNRTWMLNRFFSWLDENQIQLRFVSLSHVERYLDRLTAIGCKPNTIAINAQALKVFFRFAERRRWTRKNISIGIVAPQIHVGRLLPKGPSWTDVRKLLDSARGSTLKQRRARAVLLLTCIYALRTSEITNLRFTDLDFAENILTIRRSKNHLTQRLPMCNEVRSALKQFIKVRPCCDSPQVFTTLRRPYRRIYQPSVYWITKTHINRLGVNSVNKGAHSLRHACATHLVEIGTSIAKVANLLGHTGTQFVGHYVHHSIADLASVAEFKIRDLWT